MKTTNLLFTLTTLFITGTCIAQAPCGTNFMGFDPCSAEPLGTSTTCAGSAETFQTNTCLGTNPTTSSCGLAAGANIVWGTFTVAATDTYTITWTASNNRNIRLGLYQFTDDCLMTGEVEVACANAGGNGVDETINQVLTPGQYWVCGKSSGDLAATSEICVHAPNIPPPIVASDCGVGVPICTNLSFMVDPNGEGANTVEIPASGSVGNPMYDGFATFNPWGTLNMGCLQIGESNSTWMKVNISGSGDLEFIFGGNNTQAGFYDWIMYPATSTCTDVLAYSTDPIRCNWNMVDYGGTGLKNVIPAGGDAGNFEPSIPVLAGEVYIICFSNYSSIQTAVPLDFGGTAIVSCTPLPVEFLTPTAKLINDFESNVIIEWSTITEHNNDYFEIQRNINGSYASIGDVDGNGSSTETNLYSFEDNGTSAGETNYYRIKQVDFNGAFKYSEEFSIYVPMIGGDNILPNPSRGSFEILLSDNIDGNATVVLRDITGRMISSVNSNIYNGRTKVDFTDVPAGSYLVQVLQNDIIKTQSRVVLSNK